MELNRNSKRWLIAPAVATAACIILLVAISAVDGPRSSWVLAVIPALIACGLASLVSVTATAYDFAKNPGLINRKNSAFLFIGFAPFALLVIWFATAFGLFDG